MARRDDRLFRRSCRTGEAEAVAELFDRTAPELVRLAGLLAGTEVAEDLVQRTFVDAIEHKERYDEHRQVRPWLCGMLANHARCHRRSAARDPLNSTGRPAARSAAMVAGIP